MTTETTVTEAASTTVTPALLAAGEILTGVVKMPYLKGEQLLGAVLSFEGRSETALLHLRQMSGENPQDRLADLGIGDPLLVRIVIQEANGKERRGVWATEKGVEHQLIVESLERNPGDYKNIPGRVHGVTQFGTFVELLEGPAKGHRALVRSADVAPSGRVKLGAFVAFRTGQLVTCDLVEARCEQEKLLLRAENICPQKS